MPAKRMLISLDYDDTFTRDPDFWRKVIALGEEHGHDFVCVTGRSDPPDFTREPEIPIPIVCTGGLTKYRIALRRGYKVDVWIDDLPGTIDEPLWTQGDMGDDE